MLLLIAATFLGHLFEGHIGDWVKYSIKNETHELTITAKDEHLITIQRITENKKNQRITIYTFDRDASLTQESQDLLVTLMQAPLQQVPFHARKKRTQKVGSVGEVQLWQPPYVYEGEKQSKEALAYQATLDNKKITLYYTHFPFPHFIEHEDGLKIRAIDLGSKSKL